MCDITVGLAVVAKILKIKINNFGWGYSPGYSNRSIVMKVKVFEMSLGGIWIQGI